MESCGVFVSHSPGQQAFYPKYTYPCICRLTAGRTPSTPAQSPPLLVLPAASNQTRPTDLLADPPAIASFPLWTALTNIFFCPPSFNTPPPSLNLSATCSCFHFRNTHCAGTQDSWTVRRNSLPSPPQFHFNAQSSISPNKRGEETYWYWRIRKTPSNHQGLFENHWHSCVDDHDVCTLCVYAR